MKNRPAISTIIPVYNSELYLHECIDSLLKQSFNDIEILIIDDGSTDSSWEIIQKYASQHKNIHAFRQERKRQGAARNLGLSHAQGEFISFVDSDDMLPKDSYHAMHTLAIKHDSDLVTGIKKSFNKQRRWFPGRKSSWITIPEHKEFFTHTQPNVHITDLPELLVDISVCNKLIRSTLLEQHKIRFVEDSAGEDIDFMARLYVLAKSITIIPQVIYHYCSRPSSRTSRIQPSFFKDRVRITENLESTFLAEGKSSLYHVLVLSELRKLVRNRLSKVIKQLAYDEQITIFKIIGRLLKKISEKNISNSEILLSPLAQIRLLMLYHEEFDALIAFTSQPETEAFRYLLDKQTKEQLFSPLISYYLEESKSGKSSLGLFLHSKYPIVGILSQIRKALSVRNILTKRNLAIIYYLLLQPYFFLTNKNKSNSGIWLIDERVSTSAEDNSFVFFNYLKKNHPSMDVYYIIYKNSPDIARVKPFKSVVFQYSLKHAFLLGSASILISTDRFSSLAFPFIQFPQLQRNTHNVFLQHGVGGNKTTTYSKTNYPYFKQVIVSNTIEREFSVKEYGFSKKEVTVTGMARFDNLSPRRNKSQNRKILIAPTWRKWLRTPQQVATSKYLYFWNQLMTSPKLDELARKHNVLLYFRPHFNMLPFIDNFTTNSKNIKILTEKKLFLQDYIKECELLITDYSSVMYDFFFQEKPTICYMFDRTQWESHPPGPPHISYDQDLPIDLATKPEEVIRFLSWYLEKDCEMRKENRPKLSKFFSYRDAHNCERIYQSIMELTGH